MSTAIHFNPKLNGAFKDNGSYPFINNLTAASGLHDKCGNSVFYDPNPIVITLNKPQLH